MTNIALSLVNSYHSGNTAPTSPSSGAMWYDTANNIIKRYNGTSWITGFSFPLFDIDDSGNLHVYNGFGYIGNVIFALPGIKLKSPDGRNADGTLKNIDITLENVLTSVQTAGVRNNNTVMMSGGEIPIVAIYVEQDDIPSGVMSCGIALLKI